MQNASNKRNPIQKIQGKLANIWIDKFHLSTIRKELNQKGYGEFIKEREKIEGSRNKYFNLSIHLPNYFYYIQKLGLDKTTSKSILDIGTGMGYFPFMCSVLGHEVQAIDTGIEDNYTGSVKKLDVPLDFQFVYAFEPIKTFNRKFDVVTAFRTVFDRQKEDLHTNWGVKEWGYFIQDIKTNFLNEGGTVALQINQAKYSKAEYNEIIEFFKKFKMKMIMDNTGSDLFILHP